MFGRIEVQLRTEDGGTFFVKTVSEAMRLADENPDVWKISWTEPNNERIRLVRTMGRFKEEWVYEPILIKEETWSDSEFLVHLMGVEIIQIMVLVMPALFERLGEQFVNCCL